MEIRTQRLPKQAVRATGHAALRIALWWDITHKSPRTKQFRTPHTLRPIGDLATAPGTACGPAIIVTPTERTMAPKPDLRNPTKSVSSGMHPLSLRLPPPWRIGIALLHTAIPPSHRDTLPRQQPFRRVPNLKFPQHVAARFGMHTVQG
ncbi:hypothetical protein ACN47E_005459 [Coniothyrium glycines]